MISVEIHASGHVFLNDAFEILRGGRLVVECLAIVLHRLLEKVFGVGIARIVQLRSQHLQHVAALGINQVLIGTPVRLRGSDAPAHPDWAEGIHLVTMDVAGLQQFFVFAELRHGLFQILSVLHVELP